MNTLKRTLVILIAALAIVGVLIGFSNSSLATNLNGGQQHKRRAAQVQSSTDASGTTTVTTRPQMGDHDEDGGAGIMGIVSILSDLLIVGAIVVPVQLGALAIRHWKRRRGHAALEVS